MGRKGRSGEWKERKGSGGSSVTPPATPLTVIHKKQLKREENKVREDIDNDAHIMPSSCYQ